MATVKTAISIEQSLFERVDDLAEALQLPRSQVFAIAVEEFIQRHENRMILETLNRVYADGLDGDDEALFQGMRPRQRRLLESEW